jgi:hypothetical protein
VRNVVTSNTFDTNGIYAVLRYDAPNNAVVQRGVGTNRFINNPMNVQDYITGFNSQAPIPAPGSTLLPPRTRRVKAGGKPHHTHVKATAPVRARPKVPVLVRHGAKAVQVHHSAK